MKSLMLVLIAVLTIGVMAGFANAQEPPLSFTGYLEQNFDSIGEGTQMPDGWIAGGCATDAGEEQDPPGEPYGDEALQFNDGLGTTGNQGVPLNLGISGLVDRAVGQSPTSGSNDRGIQVALKNDTGAPLTSIKIIYTGEQWRDWQGSSTNGPVAWGTTTMDPTERLLVYISDKFDFSGNNERLPIEFEFVNVHNTSGSKALDGNLAENRTENIGGEYTFVNPIPDGGIFYISWHDWENNGTSDHILAIDDIVISSDSLKLVAPIDWAYASGPEALTLLEWTRPDPNGPDLPPAPYNVNVIFGTDPDLTPIDGTNTIEIETNADIDSTGAFPALEENTDYYWRVDIIEPNNTAPFIDNVVPGPIWYFKTTIPAAILVDKTEVLVSEEGPTSDTYTITLSKEPAQPVTITPGIPMVSPLDISVSSSTDDIEEHTNDGEIESITSTDLELGREDAFPDQQLCGMRFNNINIPTGATITSAYLEFTVDEPDAGELSLNVFGELSPDVPDTFTTAANILSSRPRTIAEVQWLNLPDWTQAMADAQSKEQTPDITSIISEITSQAEWKFGNSLVLMVESYGGTEGGRTAESADGTGAPLLHIEWTVGTGTVTWPATWSPSSVVLDASNWDTGAGIEVTAVDDSVLETDPHMFNLPNAVSSADADWDVLTLDDTVVSILENECGAWDFAPYDFNTDCVINLKDLAMFAEEFGACSDPHFPALCEDAR